MSAKKWRLTSDFVFLQVHANLLKTSTEHSLAVFEEVDAPLAQSVERFHGKEKVNSSILLGGSFCISGPFWNHFWISLGHKCTPGGRAQGVGF